MEETVLVGTGITNGIIERSLAKNNAPEIFNTKVAYVLEELMLS